MSKILLVDDEPGVLYALRELLQERRHEPVTAASGAEALGKLEGAEAAIVDLSMPGMDGLELIQRIHDKDPALPIILLTAFGSERVAVRAMKAGAYDYLTKPFDIDEVSHVVEKAVETRNLRLENRRLSAEQAIGRRIIQSSPAMQRLLDGVERVADKDVTVLLAGETGSGKELVASLIHAQSRRKKKPLVRFNCAAIPAELAEAELFGHVRGAFTGAVSARTGFFAEAHQTTLVLDEIGELPLALQPKILRALQEGEIQPVGSGRIEKVDVRIIASTNRDLAAEVREGRFREDLYYRLAVVELVVPPLRERREDIAALAEEFARIYADKFGLSALRLSPALIERLRRGDWPGNVRQLENTIARLAALHPGPTVGEDALDLVPGFRTTPSGGTAAPRSARSDHGAGDSSEGGDGGEASADETLSLREQVEAFERGIIVRALRAAHGNQSETARRLGVNRVTLLDKIHRYKVSG